MLLRLRLLLLLFLVALLGLFLLRFGLRGGLIQGDLEGQRLAVAVDGEGHRVPGGVVGHGIDEVLSLIHI